MTLISMKDENERADETLYHINAGEDSLWHTESRTSYKSTMVVIKTERKSLNFMDTFQFINRVIFFS